ncbi:Nipped-B-like protein B [Eumeta japonica]|uniref:Nipped-B-like protein B n=1 Tax=Eumeta variegata TaxID=151549 RepID=A0A4C2A5C3_EUMVA|nr:Nipped-B-like protein B [Eumeta japonica]
MECLCATVEEWVKLECPCTAPPDQHTLLNANRPGNDSRSARIRTAGRSASVPCPGHVLPLPGLRPRTHASHMPPHPHAHARPMKSLGPLSTNRLNSHSEASHPYLTFLRTSNQSVYSLFIVTQALKSLFGGQPGPGWVPTEIKELTPGPMGPPPLGPPVGMGAPLAPPHSPYAPAHSPAPPYRHPPPHERERERERERDRDRDRERDRLRERDERDRRDRERERREDEERERERERSRSIKPDRSREKSYRRERSRSRSRRHKSRSRSPRPRERERDRSRERSRERDRERERSVKPKRMREIKIRKMKTLLSIPIPISSAGPSFDQVERDCFSAPSSQCSNFLEILIRPHDKDGRTTIAKLVTEIGTMALAFCKPVINSHLSWCFIPKNSWKPSEALLSCSISLHLKS